MVERISVKHKAWQICPKLNKWTLPEVTMLRKITKVINFVLGESDLESFDQLTELTIDR